MKKTLLIFSLLIPLYINNHWIYAKELKKTRIVKKIEKIKKQELLRLTLSILLSSKDLNNAYYVAKIGCKRFPNDPYWWKNLANICIWTGRLKEAMNTYLKLYKITKNKKYREKKMVV